MAQHLSVRYAQAFLRKAQHHYPVLMIGPPPVPDVEQNERVQQLSEAFAQICQRLHIPYLEIASKLMTQAIWLQEARANDGYCGLPKLGAPLLP